MKRIFGMVFALFMLFVACTPAYAASVVTESVVGPESGVKVVTLSWTAHTDGTVTSTATNAVMNGYIILVATNPGAVAPTTLYDITLTDSDGVDVMGGTLSDRSATASESALPLIGGVAYGGRYVYGSLTLNISNQSVNSATGTVTIYVQVRN